MKHVIISVVLCIAVLVAVIFAGPYFAGPKSVSLTFKAVVGGDPLVFEASLYPSPSGDDRFKVSAFRFFISNIQLEGDGERDKGGVLKALEREDGSSNLRPKIAAGKANGALSLGIGSRAIFERAKHEPFFVQSVNALADGSLVPVAGGVLVKDQDGQILGAVGVTGDTSDNDETCAIHGIKSAGFVADGG